jgi:hypothetical protein
MTKIAHSRTRKLAPRPMPGSLFTNPAASIFTGKVDGKLPETESLPFVKRKQPDRRKGGGYDYWAVKPSGNYGQDCETGRGYAQMLLPSLKYNAGINMLGSIVLDMIQAGPDENGKGLIIGFMAELSRELSSTRASLALFAAASADLRSIPTARLKAGRDTLRKLAAEAAIPTIKRLGSVI